MDEMEETMIPIWLQQEEPIFLNKRLLCYCGLTSITAASKKRLRKILMLCVFTLSLSRLVGILITAKTSINDAAEFIECVSICITQTKCTLKIIIMLFHSNDISFLKNSLLQNYFIYENIFKEKILHSIKVTKKQAKRLTFTYIGTFAVAVLLNMVKELRTESHLSNMVNYTNASVEHRRKLPFKIWTPVYIQKSPYYEFSCMFQTLSFCFDLLSTCATDTFVMALIMNLNSQFGLLRTFIRHATQNVTELIYKNIEDSNLSGKRGGTAVANAIQGNKMNYQRNTFSKRTKFLHGKLRQSRNQNEMECDNGDYETGMKEESNIDPSILKMENYERELKRYLNQCIKRHQTLLTYVNRLNNLSSPIQFLQALTSSILICTVSFSAISSGDISSLPKVVSYVISALMQIGLPCLLATNLSEQSEKIMEDAYACDWYNYPVPLQRSIGLVMMRGIRPVVLKVGPFGVLSLALFSSVVQSAYSYVTLLRQVYV